MKLNFAVCFLAGSSLLLPSNYLLATASTTPTNSTQLARDATHMLQKVAMARTALSGKKTQEAVSDINAAMAERNQLAMLSKKNGQSMIVPLYSELDETSTIGPAMSSRNGKTQPNWKTPITVEDASSQYTFVGLDLEKAKTRLEAAKLAIHDHNDQAAADSLNAIGTEVIMETNNDDLPLLAARENLAIAKSAVQHAHYSDASAALKQASSELNQYSSKPSAKHAAEAKTLQAKVDALSKTVAQHHSGMENTLQSWWQQVDGWFTNHV